MDISCIISSGDLELYVLGMLSEEDNLKVAELMRLFPEVQKEIEEIEASLIQVSDETEVPSSSVRDNLFKKLASTPTVQPTNAADDGRNNDTTTRSEAPVVSMQPLKRRNNGLLAASVIALIACAGIIVYLMSANRNYNGQMARLQTQIAGLQQQAQIQNENLALYQDTSYQKINLVHTPGKPEALAQVFWNRATEQVYVADISLPTAPAGKQYQLWAIVDGKPVDAGVISTKKVPQKMYKFGKADAFAITLEKAGGSRVPTLTETYVVGKTS